jgi:hypothetical protein
LPGSPLLTVRAWPARRALRLGLLETMAILHHMQKNMAVLNTSTFDQ